MFISIASAITAFVGFGLYQSLIRFINGNILIIITKGVLIGSFVLAFSFVMTGVDVPLTVPVNYALLFFLSIGGIRFLIRRLFQNPHQTVKQPAVIYGAGEAGRELQNLLFHNHEIQPVAFIDDNPAIQGLTIGSCRVYPNSSFAKVAKKYGVAMVLLALPTISRQRRREIIEILQPYQVTFKSIPPISKILAGQAAVSELRPVTPEMLLGRDAITPVSALMQRNISGRSVMVTGAGGSIGSELCRQILMQRPSKIILFEMSELGLYQINEELLQIKKQSNNLTDIVAILGSVNDKKRVADAITNFDVNSIYHAAAYKHVPLVEGNAIEGINNNAFGTLTMAQTASEFGVESFTLVSTDKAVRPTNVMGASKRIAELICQAHAREAVETKFSMVRFGNVLGSSGSVIPLFQKQIEAGGPVTVTHPDITRYFMTIPEAAELVIQASAMTEGGDVFVLDMDEPVKIADLAADMIILEGMQPYFLDHTNDLLPGAGRIPISFTGLRDGEKLYEELLIGNNPQPTEHARIMKANEVSVSMTDLTRQLNRLRNACNACDLPAVLAILEELPLEFSHNRGSPSDVICISSQTKAIANGKKPLVTLSQAK
ncbi:polysaccharide biosynthesis protein [Pseudopelagicola sp. nBUS_20]|uniref:polysaccharide biosynthesis protein n=1 Tax=Pseudopelagicola sp. nBUS_20 TaxID=3395317 RepID=UPI003EBFDF54